MAIKGIDVSEFQTNVNWDKVKQDGIKFAIIRCGYGMDFFFFVDVEYERNANECERLGIPYGVYLMSYANTVEKARSEAKHVLRLIEGRKISLGVWYDIEDNGTSGAINKETLTNIINTLVFTEDVDVDGEISFVPFIQRFADNCAGVYCTVRFVCENNLGICNYD